MVRPPRRLTGETQSIETKMALMEARLDELESFRVNWCVPKIEALIAFQRWIIGGSAVLAATAGMLSGEIKKRLGLAP